MGLNSHYFHIIGDGHPNSRGLYTHYKDSLFKRLEVSHPQYKELIDPGSCEYIVFPIFFGNPPVIGIDHPVVLGWIGVVWTGQALDELEEYGDCLRGQDVSGDAASMFRSKIQFVAKGSHFSIIFCPNQSVKFCLNCWEQKLQLKELTST